MEAVRECNGRGLSMIGDICLLWITDVGVVETMGDTADIDDSLD